MTIIPIILSGGEGKRLWPLSHPGKPKPLIKLPNGQTTLEMTLQRAAEISATQQVCIITREDLYSSHLEILSLRSECQHTPHFILEPEARDTTAAIASAALYWSGICNVDTLLCILPADHLIEDSSVLKASINEAQQYAENDQIVVFGVTPTSANPHYGYIHSEGSNVLAFTEKPTPLVAETYLLNEDYYWNSGIILATAGTLLRALDATCPEILLACREGLDNAKHTTSLKVKCITLGHKAYGKIPKISFDHAVLEKVTNLSIVKCPMNWTDLGTWQAYEELLSVDENGNRSHGEVHLHSSNRTAVIGSNKPITLIGVKDLVVVDGPSAILIASKDSLEPLKKIADAFFEAKQANYTSETGITAASKLAAPTMIKKPWGSYEVLEKRAGYLVKRINVNPGKKLSLQSHFHRAEHWMIVAGKAIAINGADCVHLECNQTLSIERHAIHRLENPGPDPLIIIEIQFGDFLDEADIVRYEDDFGRASGN
ncbi:MAG: mannose-1-phosphate guanylyltransferase/mannose-6-phosphate isomerase [Hyphomicrobiales bacterium]|nr:MAG: mannose-1-phosphate guanylyltransferase/mannose-6-phosphate isomerase [Hyphomicrobiales bacterium]